MTWETEGELEFEWWVTVAPLVLFLNLVTSDTQGSSPKKKKRFGLKNQQCCSQYNPWFTFLLEWFHSGTHCEDITSGLLKITVQVTVFPIWKVWNLYQNLCLPRFVWFHPDRSAVWWRLGLPNTTNTLSLNTAVYLNLFSYGVQALAWLPSHLMSQKAQQLQGLFWPLKALDLSTISRPRGSITEQDMVSCLPSDYQEVLRNINWTFRGLKTGRWILTSDRQEMKRR